MCEAIVFYDASIHSKSKTPENDINNYMQYLIIELKDLWINRLEIYDALRNETFWIHVVSMWIIHDSQHMQSYYIGALTGCLHILTI